MSLVSIGGQSASYILVLDDRNNTTESTINEEMPSTHKPCYHMINDLTPNQSLLMFVFVVIFLIVVLSFFDNN